MEPPKLLSLAPSSIVSYAVALVVARMLWLVIHRICLHPLSRYPGPLLAKVTSAYMIGVTVQGRATYSRHAWHKKYGSVVRTGPDELSFVDQAAIRDIYVSQPCLKAPFFYDGFTLTGAPSVFSVIDPAQHSRMRRLLSPQFSAAGVDQCRGEITEMVQRFCDRIESAPQPVEIHDLTHELYLDIISQLSFDKSFDLLKGQPHNGARDIDTYFSVAPLFGMFPPAKYLPFGIFAAGKQARSRIVNFVQSRIDDTRARISSGAAKGSLLRQMIEAEDDETNASFSDAELIENAVLFIFAGSGTTATVLLYLLYELGLRPSLQARLEDEIRSAFPDKNVPPDLDTAANLPYLNCVIQETLRLRGPLSTGAVRVSPGKGIGGDFIPRGTVVYSQSYSSGRDPEIFPDPLEFNPDRWQNATPAMKVMHRPFLSGPNLCLGMQLARVQLLLAVCSLYQRFDIRVDRSRTTDEMMVMRDMGVMSPSGKKLWIVAEPR